MISSLIRWHWPGATPAIASVLSADIWFGTLKLGCQPTCVSLSDLSTKRMADSRRSCFHASVP